MTPIRHLATAAARTIARLRQQLAGYPATFPPTRMTPALARVAMRPPIRLLLLVLALLALLTPAATTQAAPAFVAYHGATGATHQAKFNNLSKDGFRMISLSVYDNPASPRYAAVWVKQSGPAFAAVHGVTPNGYQAFFDTWVPKGYRPIIVTATGEGAAAVFAAVFIKDAKPFVAKHGLSLVAFKARNAWAKQHGFILRWATVYGSAESPVYAGIWEKNAQHIDWTYSVNTSAAAYQQVFNALAPAMRLQLVTLSASQRYLSIWYDNPIGPWFGIHGFTSAQYQDKFDDSVPPWYPIRVQGGGVGAGVRYAVVFAQ